MYKSFVLYVRSLILLCGLCHYMRWIAILSVCTCNGIFTFFQLCMFNAMLGFVNMADNVCFEREHCHALSYVFRCACS